MPEQTFQIETQNGPSLVEEAAAQDAARAKATEGQPPAERPDWLPEGFNTIEAYVKSQKDTRAELTRVQQELAALKKPAEGVKPTDGTTPVKTAEELAAEATAKAAADAAAKAGKTPEEIAAEAADLTKAPVDKQQQAAQDALTKAGLDTTPFSDEFARTGDVTEENRAKIADALKAQFGDSARALVDQFVENSKLAADNYKNTALAEAGGQESYSAMTVWAKASMKPADIQAYNKAVESGDINTTLLAIRSLKQSYEAANGKAPRLVQGDGSVNPGAVETFASAAEMVKAINAPEYKTDPAYRAKVAARIQASNL